MPTKILLTKIVGNFARPKEAKKLLACLPVHQTLILEPEPENPWDANAIKVSVDLRQVDPGLLQYIAEDIGDDSWLQDDPNDPSPALHLGYIPSSGAKTDTMKCGTLEVMNAIQGPDWGAELDFTPAADPLVRISYWEDV